MRCEACQGRGFTFANEIPMWSRGNPSILDFREPCRDCGGCGIVSCCEGSERHGQLETEHRDDGSRIQAAASRHA